MTAAPTIQSTTRAHRIASRAIALSQAILAELSDRPMFFQQRVTQDIRWKLMAMGTGTLLSELAHCYRQIRATTGDDESIGRDCLQRAAIAAYQANQIATGGTGAWGALPESDKILWLTTTEAALRAAQNKTDSS